MTGGQYDLIETYFLPEKQTPLRRHTRYSEYLYVLEGEFTVCVGENELVLDAGDHFLIPVSILHTVGVLNDRPSHGLVITVPSGFTQLIAAAGTLSKTEPMNGYEIVSANL